MKVIGPRKLIYHFDNDKTRLISTTIKNSNKKANKELNDLFGGHLSFYHNEDKFVGGKSIKIDDVIKKEIVILKVIIDNSKFNSQQQYARILFLFADDSERLLYNITTTAKQIVDTLDSKDKEITLPMKCMIIKENNQYKFIY